MNRYPKNYSISTAELRGDLIGPPGQLVDVETGEPITVGSQDFGHTHPGREVIFGNGLPRGYVIDIEHPADLAPELRDPEIAYSATEARAKDLN